MGMTLVPAAPVDGEALLPLEAVKTFCKVDGDAEDGLLRQLRAAAIDWVERHTAKSMQRRPWRWCPAGGFAPVLRFPIGPVDDADAVVSIAYRGPSGAESAIGVGGWIVSGGALVAAPGTAWPHAWASDGSVTIVFEAGYGDVAVEAPGLVTAVLFHVAHLYERGNGEAPATVVSLCQQHRVPVIG